MPCNCKNCDCKDRRYCYLIENRLNALACIFDAVANGIIATDQEVFAASGANPGFQPIASDVCQFKVGTASPFSEYFLIPGNGATADFIGLFDDLTTYSPADFVPPSSEIVVSVDATWIQSAAICIPLATSGPCVKCTPFVTVASAICDLTSDTTDLSNYAAIAQNLRYVANLYGCN